jgi:hypothetical protein
MSNSPPDHSLLPQQFYWDTSVPPGKIWAGVPGTDDPSGKVLVLDTGNIQAGGGGGGSGVTKTDRSGVITLGGQAQTLMAANAARKGWSFQNKSVGNMWFNDLGANASSASNSATYLPPGSYYESEPNGASVQQISLYGDVTGAPFSAREW